MKLNYIVLLSVLLSATSCNESKFLDIQPNSTLNNENVYSPDGVESLITAAYAALQGPAGQSGSVWMIPMNNWSYGDVRSDNAYKGGGGIGDVTDIHKLETFDVDATLGNVDSKWFQLYSCVQRCNLALKGLNTLTVEDFPELEIRKAEMRFLRAHFYFELSRLV